MTLIQTLLSVAGQENYDTKETFDTFTFTAEMSGEKLLALVYTKKYIQSLFNAINNRDELFVAIYHNDESRAIFRHINDVSNPLDEIFEDTYTYTLSVEITKKIQVNNISIYSSDHFVTWLKAYESLTDCFSKFINILSIKEQLYLELLDDKKINFSTGKIAFFTKEQCEVYPNKNQLLEQQKDHCFVSGTNVPSVIPEDFFVINESSDEDLNSLFKKLCLISTLTFISDISELKEDSVYFKLYGYKTIKNTFSLADIKTDSLESLYKIYTWVYHDNNHSSISDKLGIVRNLLTLHLKQNRLDDIEGDVYTAVKSNFDIYLKENVQRYLEVKNQVSSFIHDMSLKAESHAEGFVDTFKHSVLIFISYFLSIIIVTAIDKGKFVNVFTFEVSVITMIILIISWFYRVNTLSDVYNKKARFINKYNNFKARYADIIEPDNFKSIFSEDRDHLSDVKYIDDTLKKYDPLWRWTIIVFAIVTVFFCVSHDPTGYLNTISVFLKSVTCQP